jgi:hypothetical protein
MDTCLPRRGSKNILAEHRCSSRCIEHIRDRASAISYANTSRKCSESSHSNESRKVRNQCRRSLNQGEKGVKFVRNTLRRPKISPSGASINGLMPSIYIIAVCPAEPICYLRQCQGRKWNQPWYILCRRGRPRRPGGTWCL